MRTATNQKAIDEDLFLEWAEFNNNFYGTPWPNPPEDFDVLLEIDVQGAKSVTKRGLDFLMIFVDAPTVQDQAERLRGRGDSEKEIERRIREGERERNDAKDLGASVVVNDDLDRAVSEISSIIISNRSEE